MAFTRQQSYAALASLNPAPVFLESYRTRSLPENLEVYYGPPEEFFLAPDTQEPYTKNRLIPILDDGNFGRVLFLDPESRELVEIDVECPGEPRAVYRTWQQYLASLMLQVGDSDEDDEGIRRIAELVGFTYTDVLFDYFAQADNLAGDDWWEARRQFPQTLPE